MHFVTIRDQSIHMHIREYIIYIYNVYIREKEQSRTKLEQIGGTVFYGLRYVKNRFATVGAVLEPLRHISRFVLMNVLTLFWYTHEMLQTETKSHNKICIYVNA